MNLGSYVVYLLLDDRIREDHKAKFIGWIRESQARDALDLSLRASRVVEVMADDLANAPEGSSLLAAHAMLWSVKKEQAGQEA